MQHFQTSFFYDLRELIHNAPLMRKYYYISKSLNLSALKDRNDRIGRTGHSRHSILRALIVKHLEGTKSVPQLIKYLHSITSLAGAERLTFQRAMTKLSETPGPKTGPNASNYIQITFFTTKPIQTAKDHRQPECIGNNHNHFAGLLQNHILPEKDADSNQVFTM